MLGTRTGLLDNFDFMFNAKRQLIFDWATDGWAISARTDCCPVKGTRKAGGDILLFRWKAVDQRRSEDG